MAYNKVKAQENRERKQREVEEEAGLGGGVAVVEQEVKQPLAANEFNDEYTLKVDQDYDPTADLFRIPKRDPAYEYRYLRDDRERLSVATSSLLYQQGGWQLVPKSHSLRIGFNERDLDEDGFRRIGNLILAFMPKSLHEKKQLAKQDKASARTKSITRLLKEGDPTVGGKDMHESMKGIRHGRVDDNRIVFD